MDIPSMNNENTGLRKDTAQWLRRRARIWRRHHGSSLLDDGRGDTEWEATSRRLQGGDGGRDDFNLQCGRLRQLRFAKGAARTGNKDGALEERLGMGVLGFTGSKRMRKEEIFRG
ncbi:hypothetical protein PIB30_048312 [Stylosanthes scabra]|uniref:Uncharacterized protein n=1 Tax=Stylosanthes scabra TaxID=79078 RepID=A0ABU6XHW3_9FABA|nr:hypothetical protein [Stylosanthes scabra]